jgi:pimeloyl-ACP methyl ester carboxylesterase
LNDQSIYIRSFRISRANAPSINIRTGGSGEHTFLLIHGFGDGGFIWDEFCPQLVSLGHVITVDLRGHGDSDWDPACRYGTAEHLSDMSFTVEALDLNKIFLIGHSLGADIAIRLAAQYPERVTGLVVVDFGPELNRDATTHIRNEFISESQTYSSDSEYDSHLESKIPLVSPRLRARFAKSALRSRPQGGYELKRDPAMGLAKPISEHSLPPLWPVLKKIICPVLIVRGLASSVFAPSVARRMVDVLPNGHLVSIKLAGHAVMIENPEDFAAAALSFIKNLVLGAAQAIANEPLR